MSLFLLLTIVTLLAGVGGAGIGALVGALFRTDSNRTVSLLLAFAGGVMISIVCFSLITGAIQAADEISSVGIVWVILSIIAGVAILYTLNLVIDRRSRHETSHATSVGHPATHDALDELIHVDHLIEHQRNKDSRTALYAAGMMIAFAITLHNIPEGMTIGAGFVIENGHLLSTGMVLAFLIGFQKIPEGMAISVPLICGGMKRARAVLITAASGIPTVFGAWLGFWLGDTWALGLVVSLGFASGAMLYIVFGEILPQSVLLCRSKLPAFFVIVGVLTGLLVTFI
ncbi:MAG: ZIP family metal transporter [Coriobacteriales bacterium]|nr:ZIP family metal transporter [Coriobacteriales bacterium]